MTIDLEAERPPQNAPVSGVQKRIRAALWIVLAGSIIFWGGMPFPIVTDFFEAENEAERIALVDGDRTQFAIAFGLLGLGAVVAGVGLWLLGRAITPMEGERGRRREIAARVAAWLGATGVLAGSSRLAHALFATPEYMEGDDNVIDPVLGAIAWPATSIALIIFGVLAWSSPPPKWTAVVLVLGGVAGLVTFLPLFWYLALIVFAIANLAVMRRPAESARTAAVTPTA